VSNLPKAAVCTLALGLAACFRLNPVFGVAGSGTGSSEGGGETTASSGGTSTTRASEDSTTTGPLSSGPASPSTSGPGSSSDSAPTMTSTTEDTLETGSTGTATFRQVFLTSAVFGAKLGGLEGADAKCQAAAELAGVEGTFRAWISTPTTSPMANFVQSSVPYVRIDGVEIAANWLDLIDGELAAPLEVDEWGNVQNNGDCGNVWTNTLRDGSPHDEDACTGWTSLQDAALLGRSDITNYFWTEGCVQDCLKQYHLFCVQQ
jgi:hypothetical protein